MKFTVYAPSYNERSGGAWVLHFLCHSLNQIGYESNIYIYEDSKLVNPLFNTPQGLIQDSIVIYPEIIVDNPLQADKVVRYMLNKEGALQGRMIDWGENDYPLTFSKAFKDNCDTLFYPNCDLSIFKYDGRPKTHNSFYIGKGYLYGDCPKLDCFEITRDYPKTKQELAEALRNSKILFSYDALSGTNMDAALCGCLPYLLQKPMPGLENAELGKYWAESPEEIDDALIAISTLYERMDALQQSFAERLGIQAEKIIKHLGSV